MQDLVTSIRRKCSAAGWSKGVELSRAGAVIGERLSDDEAELRVTVEGGKRSVLVSLYLEEEDWSCECDSRAAACEHVAAAAIAACRTSRWASPSRLAR